MTREELIKDVLSKTMDLNDDGKPCWTANEISFAVVAAYNKAIEDAIETDYESPEGTNSTILEGLKIK